MSRKGLTVSVCALLLQLTAASAQVSSPGQTDGPERIAILQPIYNYQGKSAGSQTETGGAAFVIGGVVIAGGSSSSTPDAVSAPDENARRVIPRLASDAKSKLRCCRVRRVE